MKISRLLIVIMLAFCWGCNDSDSDDLIKFPLVIYDPNGGQFIEGQEWPVMDGFLFSHWNTEKDGKGECNQLLFPCLIDGTMYAQWTPSDRDFNVILEDVMSYMPPIIYRNQQKGSVITLPNQDEYKNMIHEHTFVGWFERSPTRYISDDLYKNAGVVYNDTYTVEKTIVLFAKWEKK